MARCHFMVGESYLSVVARMSVLTSTLMIISQGFDSRDSARVPQKFEHAPGKNTLTMSKSFKEEHPLGKCSLCYIVEACAAGKMAEISTLVRARAISTSDV